jgi:hypothetical protein
MDFLASRDTPPWYKARKKEERRRQRAEARRRRWRVVVVGAGPAGLTAALHLKVGRRGWGPGVGPCMVRDVLQCFLDSLSAFSLVSW